MKSILKIAAVLTVSAVCAVVSAAEKVATEGARPGIWTQDYDAAIALAKEKDMAVMLNFTGSDWCGWCKLMDKQVFAKDEWKSWATNNIILVQLNFPNDKSLVPEKYVKRNRDLAETYEIEGYPTYVVLGADGKTELGRLGADRNATPTQFIVDVEDLIITWKGIDRYLSAEEFKEYSDLDVALTKMSREINEYYQNGMETLKTIHAKQKDAKTEDEKKAVHDEFAAKKEELEKGIQELGANGDKLNEKRTVLMKKAIEAMHREKKEKTK